jgi:hypothetical protein
MEYFDALHHLAWSRYPSSAEWAAFQLELRAVSTLPTPRSATDASAQLQTIAANYAAPGSQQIQLLTES